MPGAQRGEPEADWVQLQMTVYPTGGSWPFPVREEGNRAWGLGPEEGLQAKLCLPWVTYGPQDGERDRHCAAGKDHKDDTMGA